MNRSEIEKRISDGFHEMTPAYDENLFEQPAVKAEGNEWYLSTHEKKKPLNLLPGAGLAMAAVIFFFVQNWFVSAATFASVYMDVNPSLTLKINSKERVTSVHAENADAERILQGMDLRNTDIDTAVNAILGSMIRNGYLYEGNDMILLSMECRDAQKGDAIRQRLSAEINDSLSAKIGRATVLEQQLGEIADLEKKARENQISLGKAAMIAKAVNENESLSFEELSQMSISELMKKLHQEGADIDDYFDDLEDYYEFIYEADHEDQDDSDEPDDDIDDEDDSDDYEDDSDDSDDD